MDNVTKALLAIIGIGLWANIATPTLRPALAQTPETIQAAIESRQLLRSIDGKLISLQRIEWGTCTNRKICGGR